MKKCLIMLSVIATLGGCQTNGVNENGETPANYNAYINNQSLIGLDRITQFKVSEWEILDKTHLYVTTRKRKSFLLTTNSDCSEIEFANRIFFKQTLKDTLVALDDRVAQAGAYEADCVIANIYKLNRVQKDQLMGMNSRAKLGEKNMPGAR